MNAQLAEISKLYAEVYRGTPAKIVIGLLVGLIGAVFCYLHLFWQLGIFLRLLAALLAGLLFRNLARYALDLCCAFTLAKLLFILWCFSGGFFLCLIKARGLAYALHSARFENAAASLPGLQSALHFSTRSDAVYAQSFLAWILFGILLLGISARLTYLFVAISYALMKTYVDRKNQ